MVGTTGALAQQMEEQLMAEFEELLASRRMQGGQGAGGKPSSRSASSSSSSIQVGSRKVRGGGIDRSVGLSVCHASQ